MENKKQKLYILIGILVVIVIIIIVAATMGKKKGVTTNQPVNNTPAGGQQATNTATNTPSGAVTTGSTTPQSIALKDAVIVVPGANPISKDNKVVTASGEVTKTDVSAASPLAPQQTLSVPKESLPTSVVKLDVTKEGGFTPNSFTVKPGAPVTVSITNKDKGNSVTLAFTDPSLVGVILGCGPSETRAISFNAPAKAGEYQFIDGIPGHGGTGKMIVK